jgi:hypothetical protein
MTSQPVDDILRGWLAEGESRAPERVARGALAEISGVAQHRPSFRHRPIVIPNDDVGTARAWAIAMAALALTFAVGIGVAIETGIIRLPLPAPQPLPSPSASWPTPTVEGDVYTYPAAGFQITLPGQWRLLSGDDPFALSATRFDIRIYVTSGDAQGRLETCPASTGPWEECQATVARDLPSLQEAVVLHPIGRTGGAPRIQGGIQATLGGEEAVEKRVEARENGIGPFVRYTMAMHGGRPYLVRVYAGRADSLHEAEGILESFRYLDTGPDPSAPTTGERRSYRYRSAGFSVELDTGWRLTSGSDPSTLTAGWGGLQLFISSSDENGQIRTCERPAGPWLVEDCGPFTVGTTEPSVSAIPGLGAAYEETRVDGERATIERVTGYEYPARGGQAISRVVMVHDARVFVIRVWSPSPSIDVIDDIARQFRFIDSDSEFVPSDPGLALVPFLDDEAGYRLDVPAAWVATVQPRSPGNGHAVRFSMPDSEFSETLLTITVGEPGPLTLADLDRMNDGAGCGNRGEVRATDFLGTELAGVRAPRRTNSCLGFPGDSYDVYAVHQGRPVTLSFDYWSFEFGRHLPRHESWQLVQAIVDSFAFTD